MKLFAITFYKLKMMTCDRFFFAAMIVIPLIITVATGYALRYEKQNSIPVAVVDQDLSGYSSTLIKRLTLKEGLKVWDCDRKTACKLLENNSVEVVFVIRSGFEKRILEGESQELIDLVKAPSSFSADYVAEVVSGEVTRFTANITAAQWVEKQYEKYGVSIGDGLFDEVVRYSDSQWDQGPLMSVEYLELEGAAEKVVKRASLPAAAATSTGLIIVFIMFYLLFSSSWLVEERLNGTLKRLAAGPGALAQSFLGSVLALLAAGMLQVLLFSSINRILFGVNLFPGAWSYPLIFSYILAVASISLFLSAVLKTPAQLQAGGPMLALLTGFVGGCFWNFVGMPSQLERLALLTPQGWALRGINGLLLNPASAGPVLPSIAVLSAAALVLLPLSYLLVARTIKM
jgi:hypothetical protein